MKSLFTHETHPRGVGQSGGFSGLAVPGFAAYAGCRDGLASPFKHESR